MRYRWRVRSLDPKAEAVRYQTGNFRIIASDGRSLAHCASAALAWRKAFERLTDGK